MELLVRRSDGRLGGRRPRTAWLARARRLHLPSLLVAAVLLAAVVARAAAASPKYESSGLVGGLPARASHAAVTTAVLTGVVNGGFETGTFAGWTTVDAGSG